jgi:hypothetical protein
MSSPNTPENGQGSAVCPMGHPWYASWTTGEDAVVMLTPDTCPDAGAGHTDGCGLGWVARMTHGPDEPPGDWVQRDPVEAGIVVAEYERRKAAGAAPVLDVAGTLGAVRP